MQGSTQSLTVGGIIQNGFLTGLKNAASLVGAVALWALTLWIPYLNVGTTIGLLGLVAAMSKGELISPTAIFGADYRKQMGEFFLVQAFMSIGVTIGLVFLVIPGVVIALAWGLAPLLVIDRGMNPTEALQKSNDLTSGKKWVIFFGMVLTVFATEAAVILLSTLLGKIHWSLGGLVALVGFVVLVSVAMGAQAHVYGTLTGSSPGSGRAVNQPIIVGGAIGTVVLCVGLISLMGVMTRRSAEEDFVRRSREFSARPTPAAVYKAIDLTPAEQVREPTRLAPTLAEDPTPPARKVATSKQRKRSRY